MIYRRIVRPLLWLFDAETAHDFVLWSMTIVSKIKIINDLVSKFCIYTSKSLDQTLWGIKFKTPLGLSAGMDKNALAPKAWGALGFSWVEIGSVTAEAQAGNPKPRLWRVPEDQGIIVHYGLYSHGAKTVAKRLIRAGKGYAANNFWSVSLAKTTSCSSQEIPGDYGRAFELLEPYARMFTINLSCPNVPGFTGLQDPRLLEPILQKISDLNINNKPVWLKIGPDMSRQEVDDIIKLVKIYKIDAIVACNLSSDKTHLKSPKKDKPGGISGRSIAEKVNKIIAYLYSQSLGHYRVVGVGGIFDAEDAYKKIRAGASLLQIATGFVYGGPLTIKKINKGLDELLKRDKFKHISQAVGVDAKKYL